MSTPIIWIFFPVVATIILVFLRKNQVLVTLLQAGISFVLVLFAFIARFGPGLEPQFFSIIISPQLSFLGRSFALGETYRFTIMLTYGFLGIWTLCMFFLKQTSLLVPLGLALNGLLLAALSVEPFLYSALIMEIAVVLSLPILSKSDSENTNGLSRYLIYMTLGMPFILLAGWYLAGGEISPINDEQLLQSTLLLGLGFVFWLAVFPFHSWVPIIGEEIESLAGLYVLIMLPIIVFILLLKYLNGFSWLRDFYLIYDAIRLFGLIMVVTSCIWAVFQTNVRKIMGYLLICSMGLMLLSLSLNTGEGIILSSYFVIPRMSAFLLMVVSLMVIENGEKKYSIRDLRSIFYTYPFSSAGLMVALFSLTGMPLTVGFTPLQSLYSFLQEENHVIANIVIISIALLSLLFFRIAYLMFVREEQEDQDKQNEFERKTEKYVITGMMVIITIFGLFPGFVFPNFANMVNGLEFLVK